jgi:hypothetical protein
MMTKGSRDDEGRYKTALRLDDVLDAFLSSE